MFSANAGGRLRAAHRNLILAVLQPIIVMAVTTCSNVAAASEPGPNVTDIVEFTRILAPARSDEEQLRQQVSPDGTRAFILTKRANTRTDRNHYEILLLDLRPQRLVAGRYEAPVSVASLEPEVDDNSGYPSVTDLRWANNRVIVFRARLRDALHQVFQVDTLTRALTQLTFSPTGVMSFAASEDLRTVLYVAQQSNPPVAEGRRSVVVANQSLWSVMHGQNDLNLQTRKYRYFAVDRTNPRKPRSLGEPFALISVRPLISLSPDGRWAVLPYNEPERHVEWIKRYPLVAEAAGKVGVNVLVDPLHYYSRPSGYFPMRMLAYRLSDGKPQDIVDAPDSGGAEQPQLLWLGHGRSLVIAGTHLPLKGDGSATPGTGACIVEYWPNSGRWQVIAAVAGRVKAAKTQSQDGFSVTDEGGERAFTRRADGAWQELGSAAAAPGPSAASEAPAWSLRILQTLNQPPEIVAEGPTGRLVPLTRLNTQVSPAWGSMRPYSWKDAKGRQWDGGLLVPAGFQPGNRRALVIQTYGFSSKTFYLDGSNESEGSTSGFAGRAFLRENILVLAFPRRATTHAPSGEREETVAFADGVRAAIEALVQEGLVDRDRVGIMGWSRTGERVLNLITFSDVPIRAATLLDGDANTLFSSILSYAYYDGITARKERTNGGPPVGETMARWSRNDPSMHTDCIKAAVRIEKYGPAVTNNWDIYAFMRRQYKAAEMIVMPMGAHGLHTPSERMLSLQGNVDWYRFWLTGGERTQPYLLGESDETLREQYRRWQQMAELKAIDDAKAACTRNAEGF
jgi:dipeptidyl aminopeptidase/acylaminoacyl peptidase